MSLPHTSLSQNSDRTIPLAYLVQPVTLPYCRLQSTNYERWKHWSVFYWLVVSECQRIYSVAVYHLLSTLNRRLSYNAPQHQQTDQAVAQCSERYDYSNDG